MEECFIGIVPSKGEYLKVRNLMRKYSNFLISKKALAFPPHLTLVSRFKTERYEELIRNLKEYCISFDPLKIQLDKIGYFTEPPVIFLHPVMTQSLNTLHEKILDFVQEFKIPWTKDSLLNAQNLDPMQKKYLESYGNPYVREFYNPHLTLAGSDVDREKFLKLINDLNLKNVIEFELKHISVIRKINDLWKVDKRIKLNA